MKIIIVHIVRSSTPVVQWLSYSPLEPRFAGSIPVGVDGFFSERKNPEYDFLRKGSVVDLRHVKEPQVEIRASEQNLSDFSPCMSEASLLKCVVKPNNNIVRSNGIHLNSFFYINNISGIQERNA